ncbi:hypothetical protein [Embleya sp. NPDC020886]|uniref:hypothetical protein n=1 Tax=Embleya sp. NPDC020886 TaxID=3363980 RepID=UPI00378BD23B
MSTAAVLAVAGTTLLVVSERTDGGPGQVSGPASPTAQLLTSPIPQAVPKPRPTLSAPPQMTPLLPPLLLHLLMPLLPETLPPTRITGSDNTDKSTAGIHSVGASVSLVLEDSLGPSLLSMSVQQSAVVAEVAGCPHPEGTTKAKCMDYGMSDGSRVVERQDWVYPAAPDTPENRADGKAGPSGRGPQEWSVQVVRRDGVVITVNEVASREEKGEIGRPTPLLSMDRLRSIALAPIWPVWVRAEANSTAASTPPNINYQSPTRRDDYNVPPSTAVPSQTPSGNARSENGAGSTP